MIAFTFTFFLTEVICGHITGSLALIGDSYHMISDVVALVIGLSCVMVSLGFDGVRATYDGANYANTSRAVRSANCTRGSVGRKYALIDNVSGMF